LRVTLGITLASALLLALLPAESASAAGTLKLIPSPGLLLVNFVVLVLLIYPVNRWLLQPLVVVLEEREARTSGAVERAEALSREAIEARETIEERLAATRLEAQQRRAAVVAEADAEDRRIVAAAREAANTEIDGVRQAIERELESSRGTLRGDAESLAREAASRILGRSL
jgi:F0F1-type ATP synthase membrane subunit b/b'